MIKYFLLLFMIDIGYSCGTCYGDPNSVLKDSVEGMNWAIIFLLGTIIVPELKGVVLSIISIGKKI